MAALDDSPRPGKEPTITDNARAWMVSLACQKAKDLGYPHELWTTRLLARHIRQHEVAAGHPCLANIVQGTVCKILARHEVRPHKIRDYLERRDEAFEEKMAEVLCVYHEVAVLKADQLADPKVAIISYGEKPGIQAIGNTASDLPPKLDFGHFSAAGESTHGSPINHRRRGCRHYPRPTASVRRGTRGGGD